MFLKPAVHRVTRKKVAVKLIDKMRLHTKEERVFKNEVMILLGKILGKPLCRNAIFATLQVFRIKLSFF